MDLENKKYDLEKAKEDCRRHEDALEEAQSCMCGHCHECGFDPSEMKAALDEVERLRSENKIISDRAAHHEKQDATEIELLAARIKELEAVISEAFQELVTAGPDIGDIAAMSISLAVRKLASQNKRLEAAFLGATKEIVYAIHEGRDAPEGEDVYAEKVAREALEQLRAGGRNDNRTAK